jgi:hypothetical protein
MNAPVFFVAYDDAAVYAVDTSEDGAVAESRLFVGNDDAQFKTARITGELAAWIDTYGWNGTSDTLDVVDGWLIRTNGLHERIETLADEAADAGDLAQVALCERALTGDRRAQLECVWALDNAWAMRDA